MCAGGRLSEKAEDSDMAGRTGAREKRGKPLLEAQTREYLQVEVMLDLPELLLNLRDLVVHLIQNQVCGRVWGFKKKKVVRGKFLFYFIFLGGNGLVNATAS